VKKIEELVESQQQFMLELLSEHRAEVESKLQVKQRKFGSKQIEKQYEVNTGFKEIAEKILHKVRSKDHKKAAALTEKLIKELEQHEEDLVIADTSQFGWLAVAKIRGTAELPKAVRKRLEQVERDLAAQRNRNGGARKITQQFQGGSQEPIIRRNDRRFTPEEALYNSGKQIRTGT
jgi:23S rRNA U2552 (ribose-2'-O)-methylase RlmE/FtsJ